MSWRYHNDPLFALRNKQAVVVSRAVSRIRAMAAGKRVMSANKTIPTIGGSLNQLKAHIEQHFRCGMSWSNYGHNKPGNWCAVYEEPLFQNGGIGNTHFTNLRPVWWQEAIRRQTHKRSRGSGRTSYSVRSGRTRTAPSQLEAGHTAISTSSAKF